MTETIHIAKGNTGGTSNTGSTRSTANTGNALTIEVFPCILDIGEAMIQTGGDVHSIEEMLQNLGVAYGAKKMNVLVITAEIVATMTLPGGAEKTLSRRVVGDSAADFSKLEALTKLCETCTVHPLPPDELRQKLSTIKAKQQTRPALYVGGALSAGSFAIFFGGSILDGIVSAIFALAICWSIAHFKQFTPNTMVFNFINAFVIGGAITLSTVLIPQISTDMVMIGDIMLLIPGVAMTNATRDMLSGDTISGVMRFIESLLWATSLALGFMAALWLANVVS